jgi:RecB family endonuclease NucS
VDFLVTNKKGRKVIIEVKSDKKKHTKNDLTEQISRYQTDGKKKFGNLYAKTFLVSLNGRYGLTLKEMALQMKQMGLA